MNTTNQPEKTVDCGKIAHGLLGQAVRFNGLVILGVEANSQRTITLKTRQKFNDLLRRKARKTGDVSPAIASEVEYYHTNTGAWEEWYGPAGERDALSGYAVPVGMGNVAAGMVLQKVGRQIALVRRVLAISPSGEIEDMPFTRLLLEAGVDKAQLKGIKVKGQKGLNPPPFVQAINSGGIVVDQNAPFQLSVNSTPTPLSRAIPRKEKQNSDLSTTFILTAEGVEQAELLLQDA